MSGIDELLRIMARLRDPERGCPWDLDQDFASISPHTIEEAYEVDEAVARGDLESLRDELGDLLFQVVFQARLAEEQRVFDFAQVVDGICDKLVRRHPHIFGDAPTPESPASQVGNWEAIKAAERAAVAARTAAPPDPFAGIPRALPALTRSAKIAGRLARLHPASPAAEVQSRAAVAAARDAVTDASVRAKQLVESALRAPHGADERRDSGSLRAETRAVVGRGIRAWVELARQLGVDPEQALRIEDDAAMDAARRDAHQAGKMQDR